MFQADVSPFEWVSQHVQLVGWGTVLLGVYKFTRFISDLTTKINAETAKFDELHRVATVDFKHAMDRLVDLAEQQNRRFETWMTTKAANVDRLRPEIYAAAPHDRGNTEL